MKKSTKYQDDENKKYADDKNATSYKSDPANHTANPTENFKKRKLNYGTQNEENKLCFLFY